MDDGRNVGNVALVHNVMAVLPGDQADNVSVSHRGRGGSRVEAEMSLAGTEYRDKGWVLTRTESLQIQPRTRLAPGLCYHKHSTVW